MSRKTYPTAITGGVSNITTSSALLAGQVNAKGSTTAAYFQYGPTSAYGSSTPGVNVGSGSQPVSVSAQVSSLTAGTTYHYRVVATNASGTSYGGDATFTITGQIVPDYGIAVGGAIQNEISTLLAQDLDTCANAFATYVRFDINWAQIQGGGSSSYNWTNIDAVVNGIVARGMIPLATINYSPGWLAATATTPPSPTAYATFCTTAVTHYAALGVHHYEVWNEPNGTWAWTTPSSSAYATLLKAAYPAIKNADPTATVISGGLSPATTDGTNFTPCDFLTGMYANGAHGYFDALGHHPYCAPAMPGDAQSWSTWYQMYGTSPSLISIMQANGDGAKKIWATEYGAATNGSGAVTESAQASMIQKAMQLFPTYSWAGPLFVYQHRDQGTDTTNNQNWYGMLHHDFTQKPSYPAFQAIAGA